MITALYERRVAEIIRKLTGRMTGDDLVDIFIEQMTEIMEKNKANKDFYFVRPGVIRFTGAGLSGKSTVFKKLLREMKKALPYYMHPPDEYDHNIREKSDRQLYYGEASKKRFTEDELAKLTQEGKEIVRKNKGYKYSVFWVAKPAREMLESLGIEETGIKNILEVWGDTKDEKGFTTEVIIEKFEQERYERNGSISARGQPVLGLVFHSKEPRGRVKIGLNEEGEVVVYIGKKSLRLERSEIKDTKGEPKSISQWVYEDKKGIKKGRRVPLGRFNFDVEESGQGRSVIRLGETEYEVDEKRGRIGIDMPYFVWAEELREIDFKQELPEDTEIISLACDWYGNPVIRCEGKAGTRLRVRTLDLRVSDEREFLFSTLTMCRIVSGKMVGKRGV